MSFFHPAFRPGCFKANTDEGINKLSDVVGLFSVNFFTKRLEPDYVSRIPDYLMELVGILKGMGDFWAPPEQWSFQIDTESMFHMS